MIKARYQQTMADIALEAAGDPAAVLPMAYAAGMQAAGETLETAGTDVYGGIDTQSGEIAQWDAGDRSDRRVSQIYARDKTRVATGGAPEWMEGIAWWALACDFRITPPAT